jgi:hypothetical protein
VTVLPERMLHIMVVVQQLKDGYFNFLRLNENQIVHYSGTGKHIYPPFPLPSLAINISYSIFCTGGYNHSLCSTIWIPLVPMIILVKAISIVNVLGKFRRVMLLQPMASLHMFGDG